MPIIAQQTVSGDAKYTIKADRSLTTYDIHNDSPFNVGIALGHDVGILNADFYMSPHTILEGIQQIGLSQRVVNSQVWSGIIYIYTQTPTGGTVPSNAPANTVTVIGYPTGGAPAGGGYGINRLQNTGNTVNTAMGGSTSLQNDGNASSTVFVEATPSGDASSAVTLTAGGDLALGNVTHKGSISSDNATFKTDGSGNLTAKQVTVTNQFPGFRISSNNADIRIAGSGVNPDGVLRYDGGDNWFIIPLTGHAVKFQETGGTTFFACDATGLSAIGHIDITTNNTSFRAKDNAGTLRDILYVDAANATDLQAAALNGAVNIKNQDGTTYLIFSSGKLGISTDGDILDGSSTTQTYLKARSAGSINFQTPNGTTQASVNVNGIDFASGNGWKGATGDRMARTNSINNGSGSGTYNHGLGAAPDGVLPYVHQLNSSATVGYDSETTTQVHINLGAALTFNAFLYKRT